MNFKVLCKTALVWVGNVLSFFGLTIFCGLINAIGLVILFVVTDGIGERTFGFSVERVLEAFLENSPSVKADPVADTLPASFLVAVLGYVCGCVFGSWLYAKRSIIREPASIKRHTI